VSAEPTLPTVTALAIIEHLNELVARIMPENRELARTIAHRERKIELLVGANRAQGRQDDPEEP
jgi:hypothetical protein